MSLPQPIQAQRAQAPFRTAEWWVDPGQLLLCIGDRRRYLEPKVMDVLVYLADHAEQVVSKDELLAAVWPDQHISEHTLTVAVYELRKALGDKASQPRFIATIRKRGYRWLAPVIPATTAASTLPASRCEESGADSSVRPVAPQGRKSGRDRRALMATGILVAIVCAFLARDLLIAPEREPVISAEPRVQSLAVLPLRDLSPESPDSTYAEGMTEALITALARVEGLRVVSREPVRHDPDSEASAAKIAEELGVDALLQGSLTREGDRLRVAVRLLDAADTSYLWAELYDRRAEDVLRLQWDLAREVASRIRLRIAHPPTPISLPDGAFEEWARGRYFLRNYLERRQDWQVARIAEQHFLRALELAPDYHEAHAGLARAYLLLFSHRDGDLHVLAAKARAAAEQALVLGPELSSAHQAMGEVLMLVDWNVDAAERSYRRAVELDPNDPPAHARLGRVLASMGQFESAESSYREAVSLAPTNLGFLSELAALQDASGRPGDAVTTVGQALALDPRAAWGYLFLANLYRRQPGFEGEIYQAFHRGLSLRGYPEDKLERFEESFREGGVEGLYRCFLKPDFLPEEAWSMRATAHAFLGETDHSVALLEKALAESAPYLLWLSVDRDFDGLRESPRFVEFLSQLRQAGAPVVESLPAMEPMTGDVVRSISLDTS